MKILLRTARGGDPIFGKEVEPDPILGPQRVFEVRDMDDLRPLMRLGTLGGLIIDEARPSNPYNVDFVATIYDGYWE